MNVVLVLAGVALLALAAFVLGAPLGGSRSYVTPSEWLADPDSERTRQLLYTVLAAFVLGALGIALITLGLAG